MAVSMQLRRAVSGKTVVVTGSSDGIGAHLARRLGTAGARVVLVARTAEKLREVGDSIRDVGGEAHEYTANLSQQEECDRVLREILADHRHVDIFVSNAGRSIRRSARFQASERFHDFERLMALNFFGALRLILGVLPNMMERRSGHIIHVSSFGVPTRQPRFAGYTASKSALDAALQSIAGEVAAHGIHTSSVFMPLVQTKMLTESRGHTYDHMTSMLTVDMACAYIEHAITTKQREVIDGPSRFLALLYFFRPSLIVDLNAWVYRLEGEIPPAEGPADKLASHSNRQPAKQKRLMEVGCWLLWFFSRLEFVLAFQLGLPWIVRDLLVCLVFLLVLLAQPLCGGVCAVVHGAVRVSTRSRHLRWHRSATARQEARIPREALKAKAGLGADGLRRSRLQALASAAGGSPNTTEPEVVEVAGRFTSQPMPGALQEPDMSAGAPSRSSCPVAWRDCCAQPEPRRTGGKIGGQALALEQEIRHEQASQ